MFGSVPCKLHAVLENFGKILSSLILMAMSFDRYAGVCLPQQKRLRSRAFCVFTLLGPPLLLFLLANFFNCRPAK